MNERFFHSDFLYVPRRQAIIVSSCAQLPPSCLSTNQLCHDPTDHEFTSIMVLGNFCFLLSIEYNRLFAIELFILYGRSEVFGVCTIFSVSCLRYCSRTFLRNIISFICYGQSRSRQTKWASEKLQRMNIIKFCRHCCAHIIGRVALLFNICVTVLLI